MFTYSNSNRCSKYAKVVAAVYYISYSAVKYGASAGVWLSPRKVSALRLDRARCMSGSWEGGVVFYLAVGNRRKLLMHKML